MAGRQAGRRARQDGVGRQGLVRCTEREKEDGGWGGITKTQNPACFGTGHARGGRNVGRIKATRGKRASKAAVNQSVRRGERPLLTLVMTWEYSYCSTNSGTQPTRLPLGRRAPTGTRGGQVCDAGSGRLRNGALRSGLPTSVKVSEQPKQDGPGGEAVRYCSNWGVVGDAEAHITDQHPPIHPPTHSSIHPPQS